MIAPQTPMHRGLLHLHQELAAAQTAEQAHACVDRLNKLGPILSDPRDQALHIALAAYATGLLGNSHEMLHFGQLAFDMAQRTKSSSAIYLCGLLLHKSYMHTGNWDLAVLLEARLRSSLLIRPPSMERELSKSYAQAMVASLCA